MIISPEKKILLKTGSSLRRKDRKLNKYVFVAVVLTTFMVTVIVGIALVTMSFMIVVYKLRKVSPVEAVKSNVTLGRGFQMFMQKKSNKKKHNIEKNTIRRMAWNNLFRNTGRVFMSMMSLFLGIITFVSVNAVVGAMDVDSYMSVYDGHDISDGYG